MIFGMAAILPDFLEDLYKDLPTDEEFLSLKTNRERIEFILSRIRPLGLLREDVLQRAHIYRSDRGKNAEKCRYFIGRGQFYYNRKSYQDAKNSFEKAVLSAPFPSENNTGEDLGMSFSHKSLAEFELKEYESALSSADYSLKMFETIEMHFHKVHCLRSMRRYDEALEYMDELVQRSSRNEGPDMSKHTMERMMGLATYIDRQCLDWDESNEDIPQKEKTPSEKFNQQLEEFEANVGLHHNIQIEETPRKGRHWVASNFIPKDTIILVEKPVSIFVSFELKPKMCCNCYKDILNSFIPCKWCDEVVFCSSLCFSTGYETRHKYECRISGCLRNFGHAFIHVYQLMSRAGIQTAFDCEEQNFAFDFETYVESERQKIVNKHSEEDNDFETEYKKFYSSAGHYEIDDPVLNVFLLAGALETALLFDYSQQLNFNVEENYDKFVTLVEICFKNCRRVQVNVFGWYQAKTITEVVERKYRGNCVSPVAALANHSCAPNVSWMFIGPKMVMKTNQDINDGQEVCVTYGPNARTMPFLERQKKLKTNYMFDCNCEACLRDCKTILCIRCLHCSGPVVPSKSGGCLHCDQRFENLIQTVEKVNKMKNRFEEIINILENNNTDPSERLKEAQTLLETLKQLVYNESQPLREYFKRLSNAYFRYNLGDEAVRCMFDTFKIND